MIRMPLAPSQELLWEFMSALSPRDQSGSREIVAGCWRLSGKVDPDRFRAAVAAVVRRHDALRLSFATLGHDPMVYIEPAVEPPIRLLDLSGLPPKRQWDRVEQVVHTERAETFDLTRAPLWRASLIRCSATEYLLTYVFCHLVADGWSGQVFVEDTIHAYRSGLGHPVPSPAPVPSFAEVAELQEREFTDRPARAAYWREQLAGLPAYLPFRPLTVRPDADVAAEAGHRFGFAPELCERLPRVAWQLRTTPYVVLMAAYHLLLALRTDSERVVIGTTTLGRDAPRSRRVVGQFTNDVCVPVRINPDASCAAVVQEVHQALLTAMANALPYRELAEAVNPRFRNCRPWPDNHLFDSYFQAAPPAAPALVFPELTAQEVAVEGRSAPGTPPALAARDLPADTIRVWIKRGSPIMIIDDDRRGGLMVYNPHFFDDRLVRGLVEDYLAIVRHMACEPDRPVAAIRLPSGIDPRRIRA